MTTLCTAENCKRNALSTGLCRMHMLRLKRHGHLKSTRPADWGKLMKHPLYHTWKWMQRMKVKNTVYPAWDDFWVFVKDVGERPDKRFRLMRKDKAIGYGPDNFYWKETEPNKSNAERAKEWRNNNPERAKHHDLQRRLGISLEKYSNMHKEQDGKCAICNKEESYEGYSLAVDHCHETGKIRGLLCSTCNRALGMFKDSPDILQSAVVYLGA